MLGNVRLDQRDTTTAHPLRESSFVYYSKTTQTPSSLDFLIKSYATGFLHEIKFKLSYVSAAIHVCVVLKT